MFSRLMIAALLLYCLALIGASIAPWPKTQLASSASATLIHHHQPTPLPDPLMGFAINFHHTNDLSLYLKAVDQIVALGFNSLEIVTPAFQIDGAAQTITIEHGPGLSPTREDLVELLLYARSKGLSTTLMPIVLFTKPRGNEWRGKISPEQWGPWWESYRSVMNYFVGVAIESDVQLFSVGSELLTTETNTDQWQQLIKHIRSRYKGKLIYSTNWDHYHIPTFWDQLDYIGVSGYWDLTTLSPADNPGDPDSLSRRWIEIRQRLMTFSKAQKRPVIMTEVGYPTLPWALKSPWNYVAAGPKAKADPLAQAAGYRAFLAAWEDLLPKPNQRVAPQITPEPDSLEPVVTPAATTSAGDSPTKPTDWPLKFSSKAVAQASSQPSSQPLSQSAKSPVVRRDGFMGFYFYAWDVYYQGGPTDTGYGVRNKPSYQVIEQFMQYHGFKPVTPLNTN